MRGARRSNGGILAVVVVSVLLALGVALATRSAPRTSTGSATEAIQAETATPQSLAMGGAVPLVRTATKPDWTIRSRQLRVSFLDSVYFVDDQEGFVGGGGSLLVTHNGGTSWSVASLPDVGGSIASFACTSLSRCVAGGWTATDAVQMLVTRDGGSSWSSASFPPGQRDLTHLVCWSSSRCVAVGQVSGQQPWEMQSSDGGATWEMGTPPPGIRSLSVLVCSTTGSCLAGGGSEPFKNFGPYGTGVMDRSPDGGRSWQPVPLPQVPSICSTPPGGTFGCSGPVGFVAIGASTPSWPPSALACPTASVCYEQNYGPRQLTSGDGGATWQVAAPSVAACPSSQTLCPSYLPVASTFITTSIGWRTTYDQCGGFNFATESYQSCPGDLERTIDGGNTWVPVASTDYIPAISCPDQNHCWAVETTNSNAALISSSDGGANWSLVALPGTGLLYNLTCASRSLCLAAGSDTNGNPFVLRSSDGGLTWARSNTPRPSPRVSSPPFVGPQSSYIAAVACMTASTCLAITTSEVLKTTDAGADWTPAGSPPSTPSNGNGAPVLFGVACAGPSDCIIASEAGLFRTVDGGTAWVASGPRPAGSLFVTCAGKGLCIADNLGVSGQHSAGILVSRDGGATWRGQSISLPAGLTSIVGSPTSQTPSQVYYASCWDQTHCDALGLAYTPSGAQGWYLLSSSDSGNSWSVSALPPQITQVGSLACSSGGQCLIAGSDASGAQLWTLRGSNARTVEGPAWSRYAELTSLTCPDDGRCVGTAISNDASIVFAASVPTGTSAWTDSLPTPRSAFSNVEVDITSAAVATGAALFITFPSQLFNLTFQENYAEIIGWGRRLRSRLRSILRRLGLRSSAEDAPPVASGPDVPSDRHSSSRLAEAALVVLTGAFLGTLLNPAISLDRSTIEGFVGVTLAILVSLGSIALSLVFYRSRRGLRHPLSVRALPLGLVVAAGCVIVSRLVNFEPGYLYGVVCGVILAGNLRRHEESHIAALSAAMTLVVAAISWAVWVPVHGAGRHNGAFFVHVLDNALAALFISGLVNTVIVLFPLRFLAGWTLIRWRRDVWSVLFVLALFGVVAVLARSPVSPGSHTSPFVVTITLFVVFAGGSVIFREYFARGWRRAHGIEVHGLRAHIRELMSPHPEEEVEVIAVPGSAEVVMQQGQREPE